VQLCDLCGDRMRRVMGGVGVAYRCGGFYNTDYKEIKR